MAVKFGTWSDVFERDRGFCQYCGVDLLANFSVFWSATVDHVIARSEGGDHSLENLKLCCPGCNCTLSRSGKLRTFEERKAYIAEHRKKERETYEEWVRDLRPRK